MKGRLAGGRGAYGKPKRRRNQPPGGGPGANSHEAGEERHAAAYFRYRTRWGVWLVLLLSAALCAVGVAVRGGAVEWFAFIALSGIMLASGLLPVAAASGLEVVRGLSGDTVAGLGVVRGLSGDTVAGLGVVRGLSGDAVAAGPDTNPAGYDAGYTSVTEAAGGHGRSYTFAAEESVVVRLELKRSWRIPLVWIAIEDGAVNRTGMKKRKVRHRALIVPMLRGTTNIVYSIGGLSRGAYKFGPLRVIVGDWLGITAIRREIPQADELLVLPDHSSEPERGDGAMAVPSAVQSNTETTGGQGSRETGTSDAEDHAAGRVHHAGKGPDSRPYREGDPLRHLDFRAAARGRGMYTKLDEPERPVRTWIVVDQYASPYEEADSLFDVCINTAARQAVSAAAEGGGATVLTREWSFELAGGIGFCRTQLPELMRMLAYLRADGREALAASLRQAGAALAQGGTLQVYSADWQDAQRWTGVVRELGEQDCRVELYLAAPDERLSPAMSERQRQLESEGAKVVWLHAAAPGKAPWTAAREGADVYAAG